MLSRAVLVEAVFVLARFAFGFREARARCEHGLDGVLAHWVVVDTQNLERRQRPVAQGGGEHGTVLC